MPPKTAAKRPKSVDSKDDGENSKKSKKEIKESKDLEQVSDTFDSKVLICKTDICAMCKGGHEAGLRLKEKVVECNVDDDEHEDNDHIYETDSVLDVNGVWASKYALALKSQRLFVHYYCAVNSPLVSFDGKTWANVQKEVFRGRRLACRLCGLNGATLGCLKNRCNVVMHVPCAVKMGFRRTGFKMGYYCGDHLKANRDKEILKDRAVEQDISKGREPVAVTCANTLDKETVASVIEYTPVNLDSADVTVNSRSVDTQCCTCDGLCDDVSVCTCLSFGRNYTFTGGLIPGTKRRILECNFRCYCSIRRCTNRVVEKGPTARLEIFRIPGGASFSSSTSNAAQRRAWGVRTLDFIPRDAFVCAVTGQYVLGSTLEGNDDTSKECVADVILRQQSSVDSAGPHSVRVVPVNSWDADAVEGGGVNPADWAVRESLVEDRVYERPDTNPNDTTNNSSSDDMIVDVDEGVLAGRTLTTREVLDCEEKYQQVQKFLAGQICIDSRTFGNVGSFIRHAAAPNRAPMLLRRLVYTDKRDNTSGLKLALFAASNIEANTELLI